MRRTTDRVRRVVTLCLVLALASACDLGRGADVAEPEPEYGPDSWRELLAPDCEAFFDGCNQCRRAAGAEIAACTRMACSRYEAPRCLDGQEKAATPGSGSVHPHPSRQAGP